MDLFSSNHQPSAKTLPAWQELSPGQVRHVPQAFAKTRADEVLKALLRDVSWRQDHMRLYGKQVALPRLSAWYGDLGMRYTYSGIALEPTTWTPLLLELKARVEAAAETTFNSVLLNRYRSGADYIGWHTDAERSLGEDPIIGSVNFGAERRFLLRRRSDHSSKYAYALGHGSILVMGRGVQQRWQHAVPKTAKRIGERINLTFRTINA